MIVPIDGRIVNELDTDSTLVAPLPYPVLLCLDEKCLHRCQLPT
jgi:hypothetical protein